MGLSSAEQPSQGEQMARKMEGPLIASKNNAPFANMDEEDKFGGNQPEEETPQKLALFISQYVTMLQLISALTQFGIFCKFWLHQKQKEQRNVVEKDYLYDGDQFLRGQDQETDNKIDPLIPDALQQIGNQEEAVEELSRYIQPDSLGEPVSKKYAGVHFEGHSQSSSDLKVEENKKNMELMKLIYEHVVKMIEYEKDLGKKEQEQNEKENINFTGSTHAGDTEDPLVLPVEESALPSQNTIEGLNKKNCLNPYPATLHHYLSGTFKEFLDYHLLFCQLVSSEGAHVIASSRRYDHEQEETSNPVFGMERSKGSVKSLELGGEKADYMDSLWFDYGEDIHGISGRAPALKQKDDIEEFETIGIEKHFSKYDKRKDSTDLSQGGPRRSRRGGDRLGSVLKRDKNFHLSLKPDGIEPRLDGAGRDEQAIVPPMAEDPIASEADSRERTTEVDRVAAIQSVSVKDAQIYCPEDSAVTGDESIAEDVHHQNAGETSHGSVTGDTTACPSLASATVTDSTQQKEIHFVSASRPDSQPGAVSDLTDVSGRNEDAAEGSCGGVRVAGQEMGTEAPESSPVSQMPVEETPVQETSFELFHAPVQVSSPGNSQHMSGPVFDLEETHWTDSGACEGCPPATVQPEPDCSVPVSDWTDLDSDSRAEEETLRLSRTPRCTAHRCGEQEGGCHAAAPHSSAPSQPHAPHCSIQSERGFHPTLSHCSIPAESGEVQPHSFSSPSSPPAPSRLPPVKIQLASSLPPWAPATSRIDLTRANDRNFVNLGKRRATYPADWPNLSGIDAANVALSGFFFIGPGRRVRCFYCGLELDYLTAAHNIWDEHVRHRPDCPYLNAVMGSDFVQATREKLQDKQN